MKLTLSALFLIAGVLIATPFLAFGQNAGFVIIVHPDNPTESLSRSEASDLFLKKVARWDSFPIPGRPDRKMPVEAVDLESTSAVRSAFSLEVHGRSVDHIKAYWQRKIFSGRDIPPPELASEAEVLAWVRANPGAVGYVSQGVALASVKAVELTP